MKQIIYINLDWLESVRIDRSWGHEELQEFTDSLQQQLLNFAASENPEPLVAYSWSNADGKLCRSVEFVNVEQADCGLEVKLAPTDELLQAVEAAQQPKPYEGAAALPIKDCPLSVRTMNICIAQGLQTLGDVARLRRTDWLKFRNGGKRSLAELDDLLTENGLTWGMEF